MRANDAYWAMERGGWCLIVGGGGGGGGGGSGSGGGSGNGGGGDGDVAWYTAAWVQRGVRRVAYYAEEGIMAPRSRRKERKGR